MTETILYDNITPRQGWRVTKRDIVEIKEKDCGLNTYTFNVAFRCKGESVPDEGYSTKFWSKLLMTRFMTIDLDIGQSVELPLKLHSLIRRIEESKQILKYKDDWDEEGASAIKPETYIQALDFLAENMAWATKEDGRLFPMPKIMAGINGNVDLVWDAAGTVLIVRVREEHLDKAEFYGDDKNGNILRGDLNLSPRNTAFRTILDQLL